MQQQKPYNLDKHYQWHHASSGLHYDRDIINISDYHKMYGEVQILRPVSVTANNNMYSLTNGQQGSNQTESRPNCKAAMPSSIL